MPHFTRTMQMFGGATALFFLVVSGYFFMYKHITVLQGSLETQKEEILTLDLQIQKKQATQQLLSNSELQRNEISGLYISLTDPTEFLELIEACAQDAGVLLEVDSIKVSEKEGATTALPTKDVAISLSVGGRWNELYHLLYLLEHLPFIASISQANLSVSQNEGTGHWKGNILLKGEAL